MLRFSIFGFPVTIHWFFWIGAAFFGGIGNARTPEGFQSVLVLVIVILISILVHELGHAFAFKKFGGSRPTIFLHAFGGLASSQGHFTRTQHVIIAAAGPAAGLVLGGICWLVNPDYARGSLPFIFFFGMIFVNIVWSLVNLLPIPPLDGGRIFAALYRGPNPQRDIGQVGMVTAIIAGIALYSYYQSFYSLFLFGFLAYSNYLSSRGQSPPKLF